MRVPFVFVLCLASLPARAAEIDVAALKSCLVTNSGPEQDAAFRRMMLAALQDDDVAAKNEAGNFAKVLLRLASSRCGLDASRVDEPAIRQVFREYGSFVGKKAFADALARLGRSAD